jgi:DNA helicase-2/ATP-dependent DNA helicase PcrA
MIMSGFAKRFEQLNERQKEAVDTIEGPVMVVAGPGSGKTELLSLRAAKILEETQVLPQNILLLTFTESASFNMRKRLVALIGEAGYRVGIYTFHSFASDIISRYGEYFFDGVKFSPVSDVSQVAIVQEILQELPRKNLLTTIHPENGFVYERSVISAISNLKKAGLNSQSFLDKLNSNKKVFLEINKLIDSLENSFDSIAGKRKLETVLPTYIELYNAFKKASEGEYARMLISSLELSLALADTESSTKPLTEWKDEYLAKIEAGATTKFVLRDSVEDRQQKLFDLATVYDRYTQKMYERALYDFEDMILLAHAGIEKYPNLRYDLQERYQYIMIDEFQDTNEAQFELVRALCVDEDGKVNLQSNILVVGDDDQAIYKFQGAEIGNIFDFKRTFPNAKVIVLDKNYRSTQQVLDLARTVITKAVDRLEVRDKKIIKDIKASNQKIIDSGLGEVVERSFESGLEEEQFVAQEIERLIKKGVEPQEIAVICRKHEHLRSLSNILSTHKIPFSYEKKENVLEKQHIKELVTIVQFAELASVGKGEELIPEILAYPFWKLPTIEIWKLISEWRNGFVKEDEFGKRVYTQKPLLQAMLESQNSQIVEIGKFLIELSVESRTLPLEYLLDKIIGTTGWMFDDEEKSDGEYSEKVATEYTSPYRNYYFNNQQFQHNKPAYLDFLFALRTFIGALREFKQGEVLYARDLQSFLDVYQGGGSLSLSVVSPFASSEKAVSLLTAHKAKGLEFEYVFVLSADDDTWAGRGYASNISFPKNMRFGPEGDNDDDKIRLLFVALTRAKHTLYITHSGQKVRFLPANEMRAAESFVATDQTMNSLAIVKGREFVQDEKVLLKRLLENYKMPVTHLNNFLNFTRVGPQKFVEQNILRFPQTMPAPAVYGTAMHEAIEKIYLYHQKYSKFPEFAFAKEAFTYALLRGRLPQLEQEKYLIDGLEKIKNYFEFLKQRGIAENTKVEVKFSGDQVHIGDVPATGNLDRVEILGDTTLVTDLKTGRSFASFEGKDLDDSEKIKLHFYAQQLIFYTLLLKNSTQYRHLTHNQGILEFVEGNRQGEIERASLEVTSEMQSRVQRLTEIVYKKIMNLDFPDTSHYKSTLKGILQFEDDLLSGKI